MSASLDQWFDREILPHEAALMRYLNRVWPNRDEVQDLRQEIYIRVYTAAATTPPYAPKAFLFTTARNLVIKRLRRNKVIFIGAGVELDALNVLVDEASPERDLAGLQELTQLARAFDRLPDRCRSVMWMRKVQQLPQKDVARRLGVQEKAVEKQVARGMRLLAQALTRPDGEDGVEDEAAGIATEDSERA